MESNVTSGFYPDTAIDRMTTVSSTALSELTGYTRQADLEKWCERYNVRFFRGRTGIWTTLDALNAALGVRPPATTEQPRRKLEF